MNYLYFIHGSTGLKVETNMRDVVDNLRQCYPEQSFTLTNTLVEKQP